MDKRFKLRADQIERLVPPMGACIATDRITVDGEKVGYMYREDPDDENDSGWRFFAGDEDDAYANDPQRLAHYDVNTICNYDRSIIPHLDAELGTAFARDAETGELVQEELVPPE